MDATFTKGKTCVKACEVIAINRDLKSKYEAYIIWIILHNLFQKYCVYHIWNPITAIDKKEM